LLADRGAAAEAAVNEAASVLHDRLEGAVVTPAIRTPLERSLANSQPSSGTARSVEPLPFCYLGRLEPHDPDLRQVVTHGVA
jgi:hypothetical protein